jgi:ABC-type transport system substrate-binding protein
VFFYTSSQNFEIMEVSDKPDRVDIDRRTVLEGLSAVPLGALAGCIGDDDTELGERVPTVVVEYLTGMGGPSTIQEEMIPFIEEDINELGLSFDSQGGTISESVGNRVQDIRSCDIWMAYSNSAIDRSDPQEWLARFDINIAGAGSGLSMCNWANCEFSRLFREQQAASVEEREEKVSEALNIAADESVCIPIVSDNQFSGARSENVAVGGTGSAGLTPTNPWSLFGTTPRTSDEVRWFISSEVLGRKNMLVLDQTTNAILWHQVINSPLLMYNADYELESHLAEEYSVSDDAQTFTIELRHTEFTNGEQVTAEHVKQTWEFLQNNAGDIFRAESIPLSSIEVIDEGTVEFKFTESFPTFLTRHLASFGVMYMDQWQEADGNVGSYTPDEIIGSGPYSVEDFSTNEFMSLAPNSGHRVIQPEHTLIFVGYREQQTALQAFESGEIDIITELSPDALDQFQDQDNIETITTTGFLPGPGLYPQTPKPPVKFEEFRRALGMAINREQINEVVLRGKGSIQMHPIFLATEHPWHPEGIPNYTEDGSGDVDGARQVLEDAG